MSGPYGPPGRQAPGPYGAQGSAPGWEPGQSNYGPTGQPPGARVPKAPVDLERLIPPLVGGLGILGFTFGFLPGLKSSGIEASGLSASVYSTFGYHLPILILLAGLLALAPLLPGGQKYTLAAALVSVAGFLGAVTTLTSGTSGLFGDGTSVGIGLILLLIVGFLQAAAGVYGALVGAGTLKPAVARPVAPPAAPAPPVAPAQPAGFGGYGNQGYAPPLPPAGGYPPQYGAGATPTVGPTTGQYGRDDGPPPDVTQQVRF